MIDGEVLVDGLGLGHGLEPAEQHRRPELIAGLGATRDPGGVLGDRRDLARRSREREAESLDLAGVGQPAEILTGYADDQSVAAVAEIQLPPRLTAAPNRSPASGEPLTPGEYCEKTAAVVQLCVEPNWKTVTAPASTRLPTSSPG